MKAKASEKSNDAQKRDGDKRRKKSLKSAQRTGSSKATRRKENSKATLRTGSSKVARRVSDVKKMKFGEVFRGFVDDEIRLERYKEVGIALLVWVVAGFTGWVYEFFVALFETGEVYMKGGNLLPWINIYAFGAVLVIPLTYRLRRYPWAVFLVSAVVTGLVELIGGWLVYTVGNGTRYWNYDHGAWLVGSINGFVCLLSVVIFGILALMLIYVVLPICVYLSGRMTKRAFLTLAITLFALVMVDEVGNLCLKNAGAPTAVDLYKSAGWKYQEF